MTLQFYKYHLPFKQPLETSGQTFEHREGIIIKSSADDFTCYGEAAPLPGYSSETIKEVERTIRNMSSILTTALSKKNPVKALQNLYEEEDLSPSLQFGLDSLGYQLEANRAGKTLQEYLFENFNYEVPVNALGSLQSDNYLENTETHIAEGFRTIKYKVGLNFDSELNRLQRIRSRYPEITIRVDANQAWTTKEALRNCQKLESLNIEYCEEPLKEPKPENFQVLKQNSSLPLALDESQYHVSYWPNLLPYTSHIVLKPTLLGSFTKLFETKRLAGTHNNKAVFTSSLESGVGRMMTAILASGKESLQTAHGLNTGKLLSKDVYPDKAYISDGKYHVKDLRQIEPDFQQLSNVSLSISPNGE